MNKSIMTVADNTPNRKVLELAEMLIVNRNRKFRCEFIKKDGSPRKMVFVPRNTDHEIFGYETTPHGRKMVASKAKKDIITVCEMVDVGDERPLLRPRSINLATVVKMELA